jgi:hypothetical protein
MSILLPAKLKGRFALWASSKRGTRPLAQWCDNLVLDIGLNQIGLGSWLTHCYVGTGSTAPVAANTSLESQVASTSTIDSSAAGANGEEPYYGYRRILYRFAVGTAAGNLSEVGVGWSANLFARALIVDSLGAPTTVTVLSDEVLLVLYEIQLYPPTEDYEFEAPVTGVNRTWIRRAANVTNGNTSVGWGVAGTIASVHSVLGYNGALGLITQSPSGTSTTATSSATAPYSNNSLKVGMSGFWSPTVGNLSGGISSFLLQTNGLGSYQFSVDPPIAKTALSTLNWGSEVSWSRPA